MENIGQWEIGRMLSDRVRWTFFDDDILPVIRELSVGEVSDIDRRLRDYVAALGSGGDLAGAWNEEQLRRRCSKMGGLYYCVTALCLSSAPLMSRSLSLPTGKQGGTLQGGHDFGAK